MNYPSRNWLCCRLLDYQARVRLEPFPIALPTPQLEKWRHKSTGPEQRLEADLSVAERRLDAYAKAPVTLRTCVYSGSISRSLAATEG